MAETKQEKLKKIIQSRKNPEAANVAFLQEVKSAAMEMAQLEIDKFKTTINAEIETIIKRQITGEKTFNVGLEGITQIKGDKGIKGDSGDPIKGDRGDKGDSIRGEKGDSVKGDIGDTGARGDTGVQGSPDTGVQIVKKLSALEEKKQLPKSAIRGLEEMLRNFSTRISNARAASKGGGGGMGNILHETKDVGSATTTVTVAHPIAASGNALWVYYQGQFIVKDEHYTVSGKTITILETLIDSTKIDITYVRGS